MVSSQLLSLSGNNTQKTFQNQLLLPTGLPDQFGFSDIFGPLPLQPSFEEANEVVCDDPAAIYISSHSLVGPTTHVNQSSKLYKLTLYETEDSLEVVEGICEETAEEDTDSSFDDAASEKLDLVSEDQNVGPEDFEVLKVVGQGAFGKVFQVRRVGTSEIYAMKVMRKDKIMEKNHAEYMKSERDILTKVDHPFIVQLRYSFQTKHRLYLVLDFINGGHLFFQLYHQGLFREDLARLYAAEIVSAVSHLHASGVMHRDLKPENILLDPDGHVLLTDFGLAKQFDENTRSNSMCGTLEYMAPEIVRGQNHDKAADWWSVGILLYEMLTGKPPFTCGNRQKIQQKIIKDKIKLPAFLSSEAHSLLRGLLQKDASKRLGSGPNGSEDIKHHKWFKTINWKKLDAREIRPSFIPKIAGKLCVANFEERWTSMSLVDSPVASPKSGDNPFNGFSYVKPATPFLQKNV
ncbi:hypothetical protein UlMin_044666 [Ulmus minor]